MDNVDRAPSSGNKQVATRRRTPYPPLAAHNAEPFSARAQGPRPRAAGARSLPIGAHPSPIGADQLLVAATQSAVRRPNRRRSVAPVPKPNRSMSLSVAFRALLVARSQRAIGPKTEQERDEGRDRRQDAERCKRHQTRSRTGAGPRISRDTNGVSGAGMRAGGQRHALARLRLASTPEPRPTSPGELGPRLPARQTAGLAI